MTDPTDTFMTFLKPTAGKPLLGQTILAVEDSRCAGEALRFLAQASGARYRRADSLCSAHRHLMTYRPSVVIADLGLPDGSGLGLIDELAQARPRVQALIASSGDPTARDAALDKGADGFLEKPIPSLAAFQTHILALLPADCRPGMPRALSQDVLCIDGAALNDDLAHAADLFSSAEADGTADYLAGFLAGIGRCTGDNQLTFGAERLRMAMRQEQPFAQKLANLAGLVQDRLSRADAS